jgi:hypothetical protein
MFAGGNAAHVVNARTMDGRGSHWTVNDVPALNAAEIYLMSTSRALTSAEGVLSMNLEFQDEPTIDTSEEPPRFGVRCSVAPRRH